jgi:Cof subfamily protein (haloacid dehalogenase superfamily)
LAAFDGGMIIHPDLTVIDEHLLDEKTASALIAALEREGVDVWLYRGMDWFVKNPAAPHVLHETANVGFEPIVVTEFDPGASAVKIVAVSDDSERLSRCEELIRSQFSNIVSSELSQAFYLDITHPKANKGEVVRTLSKLLSIPANRFATLGDMPNDISMFKESGLSIAMGNATAEVNLAADYETKRNDDEGFAFAVETIVIPVGLQQSGESRTA